MLCNLAVDIFSGRKSQYLSFKFFSIEFNPLYKAGSFRFFNSGEITVVLLAFLNADNVAGFNKVGGTVYSSAVYLELCVGNKLSCLQTSRCQAHSVNNVVQSSFKKDEHVFTRYTLHAFCHVVVVTELLFAYVIDELCSLLFAELQAIFADFLALSAGLYRPARCRSIIAQKEFCLVS